MLPVTMANGRNHIGTITGKLNGTIAATTPSGWRTTWQSTPAEMSSRATPCISVGAPHATSMQSMPRRTLPRASLSVLPCSVVTERASSSKCCSQSALNL